MLTPKQARFVAEYLIDLNATQAAIRAGYSAKTASSQGERLLSKAEIQQIVSERQQAAFDRLDLKASDVLRELLRIATSDVGAIFDADDNLLPISQLPLEVRRAIAGIEVVIRNAKAGDGITDTIHKLKFWDKNRALETLAKHLGLLVEKVEHAGTIELTWKGE
jgi:phage terminase small subunit